MALASLSSEELVMKLGAAGLELSDEEKRRFKDFEVDGETVSTGLTDHMIGQLFEKSFKKQVKFIKIVQQLKQSQSEEPSESQTASPAVRQVLKQGTPVPFPPVFSLPKFPKDVQLKLDNKEPCHKINSYRHKIIRVLQETMAQHTLYPSNSDYVSVVKALISKYPFLRDAEGNVYHTWHMSLKRKFKTERSPLVDEEEVKKIKIKYGHNVKSTGEKEASCQRASRSVADEDRVSLIGEDAASINAHVKTLKDQYKKTKPDAAVVDEKMKQTFAWRRMEITNGIPVADILGKYPFLRTPSVLFQEMGQMHGVADFSRCFQDSFSKIVPGVLKLAQGKSMIEGHYMDARKEAIAESFCDMDFRAALVLLPVIFREKVDKYITIGQGEPATPYPTVQILGASDWKRIFTEKRIFSTVKIEGSEICRAVGVEDGILSAFSAYFVYNIAYPSHSRNTLLFLQRHVLKVSAPGDKPLPTAVVRIINLLS
ncbi:hypothetical protein Q8A67_006310 [Cirrhinus molitorella]|uniref:Sterile alpha motif domain-containing protein 3-like n=1 Tax=Cirrhinus molitorella TaxID=172907 RepID=A0AA88QAB4_9TELE|nr:hypothetical protein Q8A67_006310 [Cirrhinus molitorella]